MGNDQGVHVRSRLQEKLLSDTYQLIDKNFSNHELAMIWKVFSTLMDRSKDRDGLDKEIFFKFTKVSGLWAQRIFQQYQGDGNQYEDRCGVSFEKFIMLTLKGIKQGREGLDRVIFDMFDLCSNNAISEQELSQMLLNLPQQAIVTCLSNEQLTSISTFSTQKEVDQFINDPISLDCNKPQVKYSIQLAPKGCEQIRKKRKLLEKVQFSDDHMINKVLMKKVQMSSSLRTNMGLFEFRYLMPEKALLISQQIIESLVSSTNTLSQSQSNLKISQQNYKEVQALSFQDFRKFLDMNPLIRTLALQAINPMTWAMNASTLPQEIIHQAPRLEIRGGPRLVEQPEAQMQLSKLERDNQGCAQFKNTAMQFTMELKDQQPGQESETAFRPKSAREVSKSKILSSAVLVTSDVEILASSDDLYENPQDSDLEDFEHAGELKKMGRRTNIWQSRYHVIKNNTMYIYMTKNSSEPKHVIYLKGIYFEKIREKNLFGIHLFHEFENFKDRRLFHKDEKVIDTWISKLSHQCYYHNMNSLYTQTSRLGGGKFSEVFEAKHKLSKQRLAFKRIDKSKLTSREKEFLRDEIQIISLVSHPNVVEIKEVYESKKWIFIMMEQVNGGELFNYLEQNILSEPEIANIMKQILLGIQYLHACGIVHRDLKPENILVDFDEQENDSGCNNIKTIKLTDFGLSKMVTPTEISFDCCGTPAYVAPEVLQKVGYQKSVDLWACGVIMYSMVAKTLPFQSSEKKQTFKQIKEKQPNLTLSGFRLVSDSCVNLIRALLIKQPANRITVEQALDHEFFKQDFGQRTKDQGQSVNTVFSSSQFMNHDQVDSFDGQNDWD